MSQLEYIERDLIVIDLESQSGYPSIQIPHPIDFHDSPVSSLKELYFTLCSI